MLTKQTPPKTKNELMTAIRQASVDKIAVMDSVTSADAANMKIELDTFIRSAGTKPVSVVFLRGRQ
jgi:hypothetical protein